MLNLRGAIPSFIHISDGKLHDVNVLDLLLPEAGAFDVMDRAYVDFPRLYRLHQTGSYFVTRVKRNLNARRLYSETVDRSTGLIRDQTIALNNFYAVRDYPAHSGVFVTTTPNRTTTWSSSPTTPWCHR